MKFAAVSVCLLLLVTLFTVQADEDGEKLIGRHDGHEPDEWPPLIGRRDGHEPYDRHLIGRPDGHDFPVNKESDSSESSEESVPEESDPQERDVFDKYFGDDSDAEKPLVRCKRLMCGLTCEFGMMKDSNGCPICKCVTVGMSGQPEERGRQPEVQADPCDDRPMCMMYCEFGFKNDSSGCPICECVGFDEEPEDEVRRPEAQPRVPVEDQDCRDRPMCRMYCEFGFKNDSSGCPICECVTIGIGDRPEEPVVPCDERPMCMMYCHLGFMKGDDGCDICGCLDDPCTNVRCGHGLRCVPVPCASGRACYSLSSKCVASATGPQLIGRPDGHEPYDRHLIGRPDGHDFPIDEERVPVETRPEGARGRPRCRGPEPMCANPCPGGYKYKADGCMTCECLDTEPVASEMGSSASRGRPRCRGPQPMCSNPCPGGYVYKPDGCMTCECADTPQPDNCMGSRPCEDGLVCRNRTIKDVVKPTCTAKTLCEIEREKPFILGSSRVNCEEDGSFKPLQCTARQSECWCVDGLGHEVPDTRTSVYLDKHKPDCVRNTTVSMHIHMLMVVEHHIDVTRLDSLHSIIVDHVSSWLLIEPHYISVVKTEAENGRVDDEPRMVVVELMVIHDGVTDLPSAGEHMRRRMHQGRCRIPVRGGGSLKPDPRSMVVKHKFAAAHATPSPTQELIVDYEYPSVGRRNAVVRLALCAVTAVVLVCVIIAVTSAIVKRRRNRLAAQFRHQKLESPTVSEKNLLGNDYVVEPAAVVTDDTKQPMA